MEEKRPLELDWQGVMSSKRLGWGEESGRQMAEERVPVRRLQRYEQPLSLPREPHDPGGGPLGQECPVPGL